MIPAELLRKKRDGIELTNDELDFFVRGVVSNTISEAQSAAFLMASCTRGLSARETAALTLSMRDSGRRFNFRSLAKSRIDKHSTGGVGDKLSLIIVPLVAACGVAVPMMSGRGLGHTGGTVDKLESISGFQMEFSDEELLRILELNNCFMIKQTTDVAPADGILYSLRDVTGTVESTGLITASILSKKLVEDLDGLVMDIKVGRGAFMQTLDAAYELAESMMNVAREVGLKMRILFTNMNQPLGRAVGNWVEVLECERALANYNTAPSDLRELSEALSARMLILADETITEEQAITNVRDAWSNGKAHEYFMRMISIQGGDWERSKEEYANSQVSIVHAEQDGIIQSFKTREIGLAGIELGAGRKQQNDKIDYTAGFTFLKKVGDEVRKGEQLLLIHSSNMQSPDYLKRLLSECIEIGHDIPKQQPLILEEWK